MKKIQNLSIAILTDIVVNGLTFKSSIDRHLSKEELEPVDKKAISSLVGTALRHYLSLNSSVNHFFNDVSQENKCALIILLCNKVFTKALDLDSAKEETVKLLKAEDVEFNESYFNDVIDSIEEKADLLPRNLKDGSPDALAFRYNTPNWLVKMWIKNFGLKTTYRLLHANCKSPLNIYRVNETRADIEEVLNNSDFERYEVEGFVSYNGKDQIRNTNEYRLRRILNSTPVFKYIFDKVDIDAMNSIAVYSDIAINQLLVEMLVRFGNRRQFEIMSGNGESFLKNKKILENFRFNNAHIYEAKVSSTITVLSNPVNVFFLFPDSSRFADIRTNPDFFIHFKRDSLDGLINGQKDALNEIAPFIENGGQLVYGVPTLNNKESKNLIQEFLIAHQEFVLVEEKQFFPFDPYNGSFYFALLKKVEKDD